MYKSSQFRRQNQRHLKSIILVKGNNQIYNKKYLNELQVRPSLRQFVISKRIAYIIYFNLRCSKHGREKEHSCDECGKKYPTLQQVKQHAAFTHRSATFKCEVCNQEFKKKDKLEEHTSKHTGQKKFLCTACGKSYAYSSGLARHKRMSNHKQITVSYRTVYVSLRCHFC